MKKIPTIKDPKQKEWMVVYTRSNQEKKVNQSLSLQRIERYCPLVKRKSKWTDRTVTIEVPLFTSYVFVYVNLFEQLQVLQTPGVVGFVKYGGKPATVPLADMERVKEIAQHYEEVEMLSLSSIKTGDRVTIKEGALIHASGEVVEVQEKSILVVLKQLDCVLAATVKLHYNQFILH